MKKHLLIGTALLVATSAFSQSSKLVKPTGIIEVKTRKVDFSEPAQSSASFTGPTNQIKQKINPNPNKVAGITAFTKTGNIFSYLYATSKPLQYNKALNAMSFLSRKSSTYTAARSLDTPDPTDN